MASVDWDNIDSESAAPAPVKKEFTPTQVSSFWWGCCGLAVLALLSSVGLGATLELCLRAFQKWLYSWALQGNSPISYSHFWGISRAVVMTFENVFVPSAVIASVVPILYWRGGLLQRFGISLAIAICVMNIVIADSYHNIFKMRVSESIRVMQIVACWISLPLLFSYSPIRTTKLRLIVSSMVLTIAVCISILVLIDAPRASRLISWQALYLAGFSWALFRRNWGNTVVLEGGTITTEVERTSSRTLMELMIVSAIAIVAGMIFTSRNFERIAADGVVHFGLGLATAALSIWVLCQFDSKGPRFWTILFVAFLLLSFLSLIVNLYENYFQQNNYYINALEPLTQMLLLTLCSAGAGFFWLLHMVLLAIWLRVCGWRISRI
jgi:hypothetical protein